MIAVLGRIRVEVGPVQGIDPDEVFLALRSLGHCVEGRHDLAQVHDLRVCDVCRLRERAKRLRKGRK